MRIFLLTSFPTLAFDREPPIAFDDFMQACGEHLSAGELQELDAVCSTPPRGTGPFAREWTTTWDQWNRLNIQQRKEKLSQEKPATVFLDSDQLRTDMTAAWQAANPLSRETLLLRSLWDWIEAKRVQAPLTFTDLLGYAVQLQILERKSMWNEPAGQTQFTTHTQTFLEPVLEEIRKQELTA